GVYGRPEAHRARPAADAVRSSESRGGAEDRPAVDRAAAGAVQHIGPGRMRSARRRGAGVGRAEFADLRSPAIPPPGTGTIAALGCAATGDGVDAGAV